MQSVMKFLTIVAILLMAGNSHAQLKGFSFGPYLETAKPIGDFEVTNRNGIGAGIAADIRLGKVGLTGSAGVMHFPGRLPDLSHDRHPSVTAIPVRAGFKYRIISPLYLKVEAGTANYTNGDPNAFILSPGVGLRLFGLDVQVKYESWMSQSNRSMWGLKAGYNF